MNIQGWLTAIGIVWMLIIQLAIVDLIENPKPRKEVSNSCVVDGRTVYCILPAQSDEKVRHGEAK